MQDRALTEASGSRTEVFARSTRAPVAIAKLIIGGFKPRPFNKPDGEENARYNPAALACTTKEALTDRLASNDSINLVLLTQAPPENCGGPTEDQRRPSTSGSDRPSQYKAMK